MITREIYDAYVSGLDAQYAELASLLGAFVDSMDWDVPFSEKKALRNEVIAYAHALVQVYGAAASLLASDFYSRAAASQGVSVAEPLQADLPDADAVAASVRAAATGTLFTDSGAPDVDAFRERCVSSMKRRVKAAADDTVKRSAVRDHLKGLDVRWARVPRGVETCAWCIMLASRGFDYVSEESAKGMNHGHEHCDCDIVASFDAEGLEGYDPDKYLRAYNAARQTVDWEDPNGRSAAYSAWKALSEEEQAKYGSYNDYLTKQIVKEMRRRDVGWMNGGEAPEPTFATPELKALKTKKYPRELKSAGRLNAHGMRTDFIVDEKRFYDDAEKRWQLQGLPDFGNGYELKSLHEAASVNTINGYLKNTGRKKGAKAVVFDNVDNESLSDEGLVDLIRQCRSFHGGRVYVLAKDGRYILIR